jgi:hypothetical protein
MLLVFKVSYHFRPYRVSTAGVFFCHAASGSLVLLRGALNRD